MDLSQPKISPLYKFVLPLCLQCRAGRKLTSELSSFLPWQKQRIWGSVSTMSCHVNFMGYFMEKSSFSDGNGCEIWTQQLLFWKLRLLELKRNNSTERTSKWLLSPGQSTVPGQLCVSGLSVYLDSPGFVLSHYISSKTMVKTDS